MQPQTIVLAQAALDYAAAGEHAERARSVSADLDVVSERIRKAKQGLGRGYVAEVSKGTYPPDEYQTMATWLADLSLLVAVAKADAEGLSTDKYEQWAGRRVKRVGGRFARSVTPAGTSSFPAGAGRTRRLRERVGTALPAGLEWDDRTGGVRTERTGVPLSAQTRQRAEQWLGAQRVADELEREIRQAFGPQQAKFINLKVNIVDPRDPSKVMVTDVNQYDPAMGQAVSVGFDVDQQALASAPDDVKRQVRDRMYLMTGFGPGGDTLSALDEPVSRMLGTLGPPGQLRDDKRSTFATMATNAGNILRGFGPTQNVGEALRALGTAGNSATAEQLQPYVERAAARYVGTRVRPSAPTQQLFDGESGAKLEALSSATSLARVKQIVASARAALGKKPEDETTRGLDPVFASTATRLGLRQSGDQLILGVRSDLGALAMGRSLPDDPMLNVLSMKAGKTLPSRGLVIGEDGEVAYEAIGSADDHYTPFSAAMLSSMEGGQFVRTRQRGGPSVEDVRTLLSTGARMATVVSPSGVFELELAPEARGMKRFGPQLQSMTDAYARLLDTIAVNALADANGAQYLGALDPDVVARIEANAARNPARADEIRSRETAKAYAEAAAKSIDVDRDALREEKLRLAMTEMTARERGELSPSEWANREVDREIASRVRPLMLNGEGYALALRTLQARFPHMIRRAEYRDSRDFARDLGMSGHVEAGLPRSVGRDAGYLQPGRVKTFTGNPRTRLAERAASEEAAAAASAAAGPGAKNVTPQNEKSTSSAQAPDGREVSRSTETVTGESTPLVAAAVNAGQEAIQKLRSAGPAYERQMAEINAQPNGWARLMGSPATVSGDPPVLPNTFAEALMGRAPEKVAPLYAAMRLQQGRLNDLVEEFKSEPALLTTLLSMPEDDVSTLMRSNLITMSDGQEPTNSDHDAVALRATIAVQSVALLHHLANPAFVRAPSDPHALATLALDQVPLPDELDGVADAAGYVEWAVSDQPSAQQARLGRVLISEFAENDVGIDMLKALMDATATIDNELVTLGKDLEGKDGENEAANVVSHFARKDDLPPEQVAALSSVFSSEREAALDYLRGALRLGNSTLLLQATLAGGGADPKALAELSRRLTLSTMPLAGSLDGLKAYVMVEKSDPVSKAMTRRASSRVRPGVPWQVLRQRVLSTG